MATLNWRFADNPISVAAGLLILLVSAMPASASSKSSSPGDARAWVQSAIDAMGGADKLRGLKAVRIEAIGHVNLIEQSERPEGPYAISYTQFTQWRDLEGNRLRQVEEQRSGAIGIPQWSPSTLIVADGIAARGANGRLSPASYAQIIDTEESLALGPERALLNALEASDLHTEPDAVMQSQPHHVIAFTWQHAPVRIYLNAFTKLPTAIELVRANPYDIFWSVWGDVTTRTYLSIWTLEANGLRLPHQWDIERNGLPYKTFTVTALELNPKLETEAFTIPDDVKKLFQARGKRRVADIPLGRPDRPAQELAKDVVQIPGLWNVALIRQADGLVILEAPLSSGYSTKVMAEAEKRYPNLPIKAVVSTSDAWPHLGGLREYVARGTPAYLLDLNQPIARRLVAAPHHSDPDALAAKPRKADFRIVANKTVIGTGANRLALYPIRTESGERMLMVYWPEHHLLYASDLIQQVGDGSFFMPEYLAEVMDAVNREHLDVQTVFAMHSGPIAWKEIAAAVAKATTP